MAGKSPMSMEEIMETIDLEAPKLTSQSVLGVDGLTAEKEADRLLAFYGGNYDVRKCKFIDGQTGILRYSVHIRRKE